MNKRSIIALLCVPLLLTSVSCGKRKNNPSGSESGESHTSESSTIDNSEVADYMENLSNTSKANHFYYHYLRNTRTPKEYNNWDVWVWPYRPKEGQGVRFDWVGRTSSADKMSASGDATVDSLGYAHIDVDLTLKYDGGWNSDKKTMGGTEVSFVSDGELSTRIGTQLVYSTSRVSASEFWKNDGGNVYVTLSKFALRNKDGSTSYHVFASQDKVMSLSNIPTIGPNEDPFKGDDGTNVTYGNNEKYNTANWTDKAIKASSETFLKTAGVGYQIMVSSFADSDGDGFGDIYGIEEKLDYLYDLGVKVLWLTPIQKSDSYHGYDISDYLLVDPKFGSSKSPAGLANNGEVTEETAMKDYKSLLSAAHEKGMLVVMDLVLNHTSTTNTWFIKSAQLDESTRGYYQWGNNESQSDVIKETNYWYPYGDHYYSYYAKFGSSMPELNYAYADTRGAVITMAKKWCEIGVDGFRMDAVKHIFLEDEIDYDSNDTYIIDIDKKKGTNYSSDLTKNLNFWKEVNYEVKQTYPNAFFVGENFDGHAYHVAPFYEGFDSLFDFYSYFNLTSAASYYAHSGNLTDDPEEEKGGYQPHLSTFAGAWDATQTADYYKKDADDDLKGNTKSIKYDNQHAWNLLGVFDTNNKYRTGGQSASATSGYSMINGAFTSNHDIARTVNRIAGTYVNNTGLTKQGEVTTSNYDSLNQYATLVQIAELMLPGLTWIYYGDELGMTGNFPAGKDANSGYADLAYRQPMKWKDNSIVTGYGISGSDMKVEWDGVNSSNKVAFAEDQMANSNSHYSVIKAFANAKNADQTLINGIYAASYDDIHYNADLGIHNPQKGVLSFTRSLNGTQYRVIVNFTNNAVSYNGGKTVIASYGTASTNSVGAKSAVLTKLGDSGTPTGQGYGLKFGDGRTFQGNKLSDADHQGRTQYLVSACSFKAGDTFQLYDFEKDAVWAIDIDTASFGANGNASIVAQYVIKSGDKYIVQKDFTADVYIKLKYEDDQIYFGLI